MTAQLKATHSIADSTMAIAHPATAKTTSYPRRPFTVKDAAQPGTSFYDFRKNLQRAVKQREAGFIRAIAAPDIHLSFGLDMTLNDLDIDHPQSLFWKHLERIIHAPCAPRIGSMGDPKGTLLEWACPAITEVEQLPDHSYDPYVDIFMIGTSINVRKFPGTHSSVIASLSNEVVKAAFEDIEQLSETQQALIETSEGWRPIVTPDGKRGFVSSCYAFSAIGYRAFFENKGQGWFMTVFVTGD